MSDQPKGGIVGFFTGHPRPIGTMVAGGAAYLLDVFTFHGLFVALGLESGDDLAMPWVTRVVWWALLYALGSAFVSRLMWREAELSFTSGAQLWAASHVDAVKRIARRIRWWSAGIRAVREQRRRHRPAEVPVTVPARSRTVPGTAERQAA